MKKLNNRGIAVLGVVAIVAGVVILGAVGFLGLALNGLSQLSGH